VFRCKEVEVDALRLYGRYAATSIKAQMQYPASVPVPIPWPVSVDRRRIRGHMGAVRPVPEPGGLDLAAGRPLLRGGEYLVCPGRHDLAGVRRVRPAIRQDRRLSTACCCAPAPRPFSSWATSSG
jgi:hypothetical protein